MRRATHPCACGAIGRTDASAPHAGWFAYTQYSPALGMDFPGLSLILLTNFLNADDLVWCPGARRESNLRISGAVIDQVGFGVAGPGSKGIAIAKDGPSNAVSVIDAATMKPIASIAVGHKPWGVAAR